jgi:hypothetical protein
MTSDDFTNLRQHRAEGDAWAPRAWWSRLADDPMALALGSLAGAALILYGSTPRRSGLGVWWLISGVVAGCVAASLGGRQWRRDAASSPRDVVTQESMDSFPASDAPASNASTATAQPLRGEFGRD